MNLCYDVQKWTTITIASIAISLTVGFFLIQDTHGITEEQRQANREKYAKLIEEDFKKQDNGTMGCTDPNSCGTPSLEFADRQQVFPPTEEKPRLPSKIWCELGLEGYYYEDNGEPHCITN